MNPIAGHRKVPVDPRPPQPNQTFELCASLTEVMVQLGTKFLGLGPTVRWCALMVEMRPAVEVSFLVDAWTVSTERVLTNFGLN